MASTTEAGLGAEWQALAVKAREVYPPRCHVCKQSIDLTLPPRTRLSWSLDHLDPRAVHGPETPTLDRVRPAHVACNSRKGKRTEAPPRRWVM